MEDRFNVQVRLDIIKTIFNSGSVKQKECFGHDGLEAAKRIETFVLGQVKTPRAKKKTG